MRADNAINMGKFHKHVQQKAAVCMHVLACKVQALTQHW